MEPLIELKNVNHTFGLSSGQRIKVLKDINLHLMPKEVLAILGPSGSGKSTTLRIMAGLLEATHGQVLSRGKPLHGPNRDIAMIFQSFALLPWLNVAENVAVGLSSVKLLPTAVRDRVKRSIDLVGLEGFEEAYPRELSGGMKQRVGVARAIVMERPILLLDEPFSALDVLTAEGLRREVLNLYISEKTSVQSLVLVTHNILEAASLGGRIIVMGSNPGQIRLTIRNDLPYPRDEKSGAFKNLVDNIHDVVTQSIIPDTPEWVPPALLASTVESIPPVSIQEVAGLLEVLSRQGGRADAFSLSQHLTRDSIHILLMAKAAELLDLVDTPRNNIVLTELGQRFVGADVNGRKQIIHDQLGHLKLTQIIKERLQALEGATVPFDEALEWIKENLPNENPADVLNSLIQWGRYGEVFGYNDDAKTVYLDTGQETSLL